jgi:hypothetical protein
MEGIPMTTTTIAAALALLLGGCTSREHTEKRCLAIAERKSALCSVDENLWFDEHCDEYQGVKGYWQMKRMSTEFGR